MSSAILPRACSAGPWRSALTAALTLAAVLAAPAVQADTVTLRADAWCPLNCAPDSAQPGYGIEIAEALYETAGHTVEYQLMPWARALVEVKHGRVIGAIGADPAEDPELIYPQHEIGMADTGFAVRAGSGFRYDGLESLAELRIGAVRDYVYDDGDIDAYLAAHADDHGSVQLLTGNDVIAKNLRKLLANRVDVVLDSPFVLHYEIARLGLADRVDVVALGDPTPVYIAFSPVHPQGQALSDLFDAGMAELRASGELAAILARYGLTDWRE